MLWSNKPEKAVGTCIPLYLELRIPSDYPDAVPQPDLSNINNAPYAPAVKDQAMVQLKAEVRIAAQGHAQQMHVYLNQPL